MMKKSIIVLLLFTICLAGCNSTEKSKENNQTEENTTQSQVTDDNEKDDTSKTIIEIDGEIVSTQIDGDFNSWKEAYLYYLQNPSDIYNIEDLEAVLLYLDDDSIPELLINTNVEASGEQVLSFYDGKLNFLQLSRIGSSFKEGEGLIYNDCGHMDYYPVNIYKLYHGQSYLLFEGLYGALDDRTLEEVYETEGDPAFNYQIEGKEVTKDEFEASIKTAFGEEEGTRPESFYTIEEMKEMLR